MSDEPRTMSRRLRPALISIRRFLDTGNFIRFLVAVVLAFGLWAWVTYENDPETTRTIGGLTVTLENLAADLEVVGEPPLVDVTIQGPQSVVGPLERESVEASVNMEDVDEAGEYEFDIDVEVPSGIRTREVLPDTVVIEVDRISSRTEVPLMILEPDDVPPNYQVQEISAEVETVTITGPQLSINRVARAEVPVQIDGRTASFNDSWTPRAVDASGQEVAGVQIEPNDIMVSVTLDIRGQIRKIIPVVIGDDALAPGFELVRTTVLPADEVVVDGPDEDLSSIFFVTTVPIDISGWDDSEIVRDVSIDRSRLPDSVTLDVETVHVSVEIRRQVHQREISDVPINVMNPASGTEIVLTPERATVVLEGSRAAIDAVDPNDVTVFVNVANAEPGEYEFELRVIVPAQVQYREVDPPFVDVEVTAEDDEPQNNGPGAEDL